MSRLITALKGGSYLEPAKITVATHMERWLEHVRSQVSPKTFERYCGVVRGNILPVLGSVLLTKLQPAQISETYAKALDGGRKDGNGGLSPASVLYMHRLSEAGPVGRCHRMAAVAMESSRPDQGTQGQSQEYACARYR